MTDVMFVSAGGLPEAQRRAPIPVTPTIFLRFKKPKAFHKERQKNGQHSKSRRWRDGVVRFFY
jgi:hypothetical protein